MGSSFPPMPELPVGSTACIAYSGGADSRALLGFALAAYGPERAFAIHVNHGIQDQAGAMEAFCKSECGRAGARLAILRPHAAHAKGESPEAAARDARYAALAAQSLASRSSFCLLGHHAQDQTETLILALSRGLGLPGLSGMGERFERHGALFLRPLLSIEPSSLREACLAQGWGWTEDPTNSDERFSRNSARAKVIPALSDCFPHFARAAARSMAHCAQAQELLNEVAAADLLAHSDMKLARLRALTDARLANLLRHWLKSLGAHPAEAQLSEALSQIRASIHPSRGIDIKCAHGRLRRVGDLLAFHPTPLP